MKRQQYEFVELYNDGTELVRHKGSYAMCAHLYLEFRRAGFCGEIRLAK